MLSEYLMNNVCQFIKDEIKTAVVVFEGKDPEEVQIIRKAIDEDTLKVLVNTSKGVGTITDIRLLDEKGNVLISKPKGHIKTIDHGVISTFWIRIVEEEVQNPISVFELKGAMNG
ncbi:hypothetical protein JNO63_07220 [Anaerococcus sp. mt242]|uniref:hypothetical protein n=1 Tax=Anaerococcus sp. mt242 TaxID=2661917 RepID=UPI00193244BE|nr:hypothetical protein [Anaerococcus sp. mt242]MBM0046881.1 hypothetical protein [Anaerococcus sp. mt242]